MPIFLEIDCRSNRNSIIFVDIECATWAEIDRRVMLCAGQHESFRRLNPKTIGGHDNAGRLIDTTVQLGLPWFELATMKQTIDSEVTKPGMLDQHLISDKFKGPNSRQTYQADLKSSMAELTSELVFSFSGT